MKIWGKTTLNVYIFLHVLLFFQVKEVELVCDISHACDSKVPGTKIEDPFDCHKYYICVTNGEGDVIISDARKDCPPNYYFSDIYQDCLLEEFKCRNKCDNVFCSKSCNNVPDGTQVAYPNDCSRFKVCVHDSEPIVAECSSEVPYFNGTSCSTDEYSCCEICTPYCKVAFTEVEDPYDCYSFYLCQSDDYIPEDEHFSCESGKYFNVTEGKCVDTNGTCYHTCNRYTTTMLPPSTTVERSTTESSLPISTNQFLVTSTIEPTETEISYVAPSLTSTITYTSFTDFTETTSKHPSPPVTTSQRPPTTLPPGATATSETTTGP